MAILMKTCPILLVTTLIWLDPTSANHVNLQQIQPTRPQTEINAHDLIKVHESSKKFNWLGANQSELAPESQVVGVYFDTLSLNIAQDELVAKVTNQLSKTNNKKQSQDFETHQTELASSSVAPARPRPDPVATTTALVATTESSGTKPAEGQQDDSSPATADVTTTQAPAGLLPDEPVGSRTIRSGSAVFCGEANPNGKSNKNLDRIIGGYKSEPGEFPFQVRLNIRSRRGSGICGGVILDDWHILTAAHCMTACVSQHLTTATIENTGVKATIGDHAIRSSDGEIELDVDKITPHEKYDACNFYANDHDIALIKTSTPIEYRFTADGYGSINRPCMPKRCDLVYEDGEKVIVSGWGVTRENSGSLSNILRYVQVPIVNVTRCQETYGSRVTNDHVCAGFQAGGKDSCQGDSGGPLVRVVDNRYELVGIVSFGYGCGQPSAPGVYTRVASYIDWINANL